MSWNIAVRRILILPYQTHKRFLGPCLNQQHTSNQLYAKNCIIKKYVSNNCIVESCFFSCMNKRNTHIRLNLSNLRYPFNCSIFLIRL